MLYTRIILVLSKLEHESVVWNNFILADSHELQTYTETLQIYVIIDLFTPISFVIVNQCREETGR